MRHLYRCPLRWADLDLLGHVNNVTYVDYLQEARVDMMRTHVPSRENQADDLAEGVVVVSHRVSYRAPLTFRLRPVQIECWVTQIRAATFTMAYEIFDDDDHDRTVYLRATTVLTPFVFAEERPRRLRPEERAALTPFLEPVTDADAPLAWSASRRTELGHYPVHVRFSDVDVYGHVNNVEYFTYFQEGRIRLTAALGEGLPPGTAPLQVVVAQTDVDYRTPILLRPEPYDEWSWVTRTGRTSFTIESEILDQLAGDRLLARARVTMVCWDERTARPAEPPAGYRALLAEALAAGRA